MRSSTKRWRWLLLGVAICCFTGSVYAQRTVSLQLNTATLADTMKATDFVEVRGAIGGAAPFTLPDANVIDWGDASTIEPASDGGDYWSVSFQIPDNEEMAFKFYTEPVGGWEAGGNNHILAAGTGNVDMGLHYYGNADDPYDWRPFASKPDTVAVWFRVYMCTEGGLTALYNPNDTGQIIGVRGDDFTQAGPLDWGVTKVQLSQESSESGTTGFDLWSGVAYYPTSLVGSTQAYKFFVEPEGWEADAPTPSNNREFTIPSSDSTLHWVYFSHTAPTTCGVQPVTQNVIFSVDLDPLEQIGLFSRAREDTLQVRGGFNGWDCDNPDDCILFRIPGETIFEQIVPLTAIPATEQGYKFYIEFNDDAFMTEFGELPPNGWEEPISTTGANRFFEFEGNPSLDQFLGDQRFNDIFAVNIIPAGTTVDVKFSVDMAAASVAPEDFDPATDSVFVELVGDALWAFTQRLPRSSDGIGFEIDTDFVLTDPDENGIFEGVLTVTGPTYSGIQYKFAYGGASTNTPEAGGNTAAIGRRRTRFIVPNPDGSWPATFAFVQETYQPEGALPFEENPATSTGVEAVGGELPSQVTLSENFPNPFNPTTSFEYTVDRTMKVELYVYDILGRRVATLVNGQQPANTYRVSFDAAALSSGTYFYRLEAENTVITRAMVLLK